MNNPLHLLYEAVMVLIEVVSNANYVYILKLIPADQGLSRILNV